MQIKKDDKLICHDGGTKKNIFIFTYEPSIMAYLARVSCSSEVERLTGNRKASGSFLISDSDFYLCPTLVTNEFLKHLSFIRRPSSKFIIFVSLSTHNKQVFLVFDLDLLKELPHGLPNFFKLVICNPC